jgi:hypothetical protein
MDMDEERARLAAAQRNREDSRKLVQEQIPEGVELTESEERFLNRLAIYHSGVALASILRKVRKAGWAEGRIYGNEHGMKDHEYTPEI